LVKTLIVIALAHNMAAVRSRAGNPLMYTRFRSAGRRSDWLKLLPDSIECLTA